MPHRVLLIENDSALRAAVRPVLEAEGLSVDEVDSGLAGIRRALASPPDLVVAGVRLPDIDGCEVATRLKAEKGFAQVPFLVVGDSSAQHDLALAAGCDAFVVRPVEPERFRAELRAILAGERERLPEAGERAGLKAHSAAMAERLERTLAEVQVAESRLAERNRLGGIFMKNLAHELSGPLTPVAGYLSIMASEKAGPLTPQQRKIVESLQGSVARMSRTVENLSDFASLALGQAPLFPSEVDPDALAGEVVADLRLAAKDARLNVKVVRSGGGKAVADPRKLKQALFNLVQNAVKFSPHGGEVLVEVERDGDQVRFLVYDQGPGIPAADQQNVFEPFFHAKARQEGSRQPGSGLGLPVARRVAEAHGGRVLVESPPRTQSDASRRHYTGSKFVLEIPAAPPAAG
ncbi:MAG TPA: ATP-binding protein [Anaeromyxobacteraceae bacterium]|nr:ATP-binding protein [Anaeromyxobacteraceae bacterium]